MRVRGWFPALTEVIARHSALPFEYGISDCFIFPMDCVLAVTGTDPWADERDYSTELGAARRLLDRGFTNVGDAFAAQFTEINVMFMGRGDLCVVEQDGEVCGAVCVGDSIIGKAKGAGLVTLPRGVATRAFQIG